MTSWHDGHVGSWGSCTGGLRGENGTVHVLQINGSPSHDFPLNRAFPSAYLMLPAQSETGASRAYTLRSQRSSICFLIEHSNSILQC
nr:hypothetical protein Iba_chr13eCG7560 [Ipomoea batatas]